jgi:hypothetical protein
MTRRAYLLLALLALPFGIAAQAPKSATPSEPALEIILPADSARAREAPVVRSVRMLSDRTTRELLFSGFPARLHFRLELWKANRFFDDLVRTIEWDVVVSYDPLARHYTVTRIAGRWQSLGTFADLKDAEDAVARPFVPGIQPPTGHSKYYYYASLDLEMLSVHDIDEVKRWLGGDADSAMKGRENPGTALGHGANTLVTRLLGGQTRTYHARSAVFRPQ